MGTGVSCTDSEECEDGEFCDMVQFDFNTNGIGDSCECYADCNCDTKVNLSDLVLTKNEFLRDDCSACAATSIVTTSVSTTIPPDYPAPVPKTWQTISYAIGDDGDLEKGVAWPSPRFTDNLDGTITDNLTGLIWLKDANCFGQITWNIALSVSNGLQSGQCGLTDGSSAGDWRLPNIKELQSLIDFRYTAPALPSGHPFINEAHTFYWSSTTPPNGTGYACHVDIGYGNVYNLPKTSSLYVWPVRGPE